MWPKVARQPGTSSSDIALANSSYCPYVNYDGILSKRYCQLQYSGEGNPVRRVCVFVRNCVYSDFLVVRLRIVSRSQYILLNMNHPRIKVWHLHLRRKLSRGTLWKC